jgi:hypothetical protein
MSEELNQALEAAKADLATAKENFKKFLTKNNLKAGVTPKDEALAKKLAGLEKKIATAEKGVKDAKKALKPKKEKAERVSKYEYPADCTSAEDRKKFRTSQRNAEKSASKKSTKAEKVEAKPSKKKAEAEVEAPVKKKKKVVVATEED